MINDDCEISCEIGSMADQIDHEPTQFMSWCTRRGNFHGRMILNKAGYTATEVACGWAGAIFEVTRLFGQEQ